MKKLCLFFTLPIAALTACQQPATPSGHSTDNTHRQLLRTGNERSFIPLDSANKMISSYLGSLDTSGDEELHSLIVDANDLRDYLNSETGKDISSLKIIFAHKLSYINNGNRNVPCGYSPLGLTVILAGYNQDNNYIYHSGQVMDMARPCPSECPSSGSASLDTLQP